MYLDYTPENHWSIGMYPLNYRLTAKNKHIFEDPFGLSPTVAYLVKHANLKRMAINRIHYSVKRFLGFDQKLEFYWRQLFAGSSSKSDILTHIFSGHYDIPNSVPYIFYMILFWCIYFFVFSVDQTQWFVLSLSF